MGIIPPDNTQVGTTILSLPVAMPNPLQESKPANMEFAGKLLGIRTRVCRVNSLVVRASELVGGHLFSLDFEGDMFFRRNS